MDKLKTLYKKSKNKKYWIFLFLIFVIIISMMVHGYWKNMDIAKNKVETSGKITDFKHRNMTYYSIKYEYEVDGKIYEGSVGVEYFDCFKTRDCIGSAVRVFYSSEKPNFSQVNLGNLDSHRKTIYPKR